MQDKLRLVGRRIVEVRPMTAEEKEREGWETDDEIMCAVLENGAILYAGSLDGEAPGQALAQSQGGLWTLASERAVEIPPQHRRQPSPPPRAQGITTALAVLFSVSAIVMVIVSLYDGGQVDGIRLFGAGALGQGAAAACLWLLRSFIRAGSQ